MRRQVTTIIAVAGLALVPASVAGAQPSPESHVAGTTSTPTASQPLRDVDLRSPDTRDAATIVVVPSGVIAKSTPVTPSASDNSNSFGWDDAGMGAGALAL